MGQHDSKIFQWGDMKIIMCLLRKTQVSKRQTLYSWDNLSTCYPKSCVADFLELIWSLLYKVNRPKGISCELLKEHPCIDVFKSVTGYICYNSLVSSSKVTICIKETIKQICMYLKKIVFEKGTIFCVMEC